MVPETNINDFVNRLRATGEANLVSIILYGSAAAGDYVAEHSDVNLLCVLRETSFAFLQTLAPAVGWWREQKNRIPLVMGMEELKRSADVFSIELLDMRESYRVLWGEDVLSTLAVAVKFHRVQLEYELRELGEPAADANREAAKNLAEQVGFAPCAFLQLLVPRERKADSKATDVNE